MSAALKCVSITNSDYEPVVGNLPKFNNVEDQFQTKVLILNDQEHLDSLLHYVEKGN